MTNTLKSILAELQLHHKVIKISDSRYNAEYQGISIQIVNHIYEFREAKGTPKKQGGFCFFLEKK